jgi:hypothetical protein
VPAHGVDSFDQNDGQSEDRVLLVANALGVRAATLWAEPAPAEQKGRGQGRPRKAR